MPQRKEKAVKTSSQKKEKAGGNFGRKEQEKTGTSSQQQVCRTETPCQKQTEVVRTNTQQQDEATGSPIQEKESAPMQREESAIRTTVQEEEKDSANPEQEQQSTTEIWVQKQQITHGICTSDQKITTRIATPEQKRVSTTPTHGQKSASKIPIPIQGQERRTGTPSQRKITTETPVQQQEKTSGTPAQENDGTPAQKQKKSGIPVPKVTPSKRQTTGTPVQKEKETIKAVTQTQEGTLRTLEQKKEAMPETPVQMKETISETALQKEKITLETAVQQEKATFETAVKKEETTPETAVQQEKETLETAAQNEETTLETAVQQEKATFETAVKKEETTPETAVQQEKATLEAAVQKEETAAEIAVQQEKATLETEVQKEGTTLETTVQLPEGEFPQKQEETQEEAIRSAEEMGEKAGAKVQDVSKNERINEQSTTASMHPPPATFFQRQQAQFISTGMYAYNQVTQRYEPILIPQQAGMPFNPAYGPVSVPPYLVEPTTEMMGDHAGPSYSQVPQTESLAVPTYPVRPVMQMVETRSGPLYTQVMQEYRPIPIMPQFPHPIPGLAAPAIQGIPPHPLSGQVMSQFPQPVSRLPPPPTAGIPTEMLPGQAMRRFLHPVSGPPVPPTADVPADPLPSQLPPQLPQLAPGLSELQMGEIPASSEVVQQFNAPYPRQFQVAGGSSIIQTSRYSHYNQPYFQTLSGPFSEAETQQFLDRISKGSRSKKYYYRDGEFIVTEVNVSLSEPTITLSVAGNMPTIEQNQDGTEGPPQFEFIYGRSSMMRIELSKTEPQQPKVRIWPRARKHRRDKLVVRRQAEMIEALFQRGESDLEWAELAHSNEKLDASLESMPEKVLIKIFEFIAQEQNNNPNVSIHNMYRLALVCKRFKDVLENNAEILPRYQLSGLRIKSKRVGPLGCFAIVHRYGSGAFEPPCACLDLNDVPSFLRHDVINGFIYIDRMEITDGLFLTLNELTYAENVKKIVFSKIDSVRLTGGDEICKFLDKFPNLSDLQFFGNYEENDLQLHRSRVVKQMQRSRRGNGLLSRKEINSLADRLKRRKKNRLNARALVLRKSRTAVKSKTKVQKKTEVQNQNVQRETSGGENA